MATVAATAVATAMAHGETIWDRHGRLEVSANHRYLEHADSTPFFWLGGTVWGMGSRATREDVDLYLDDRHAKGFTVVQAVIHWRHSAGPQDGWGARANNPVNPYGDVPFAGGEADPDTAAPLIVPGGTPGAPNDYWDHIDYMVAAVRQRGMALVLLPTWGRQSISSSNPREVVFDAAQARAYGEFLGRRYADQPHIIWTLGGDTVPAPEATYHAIARGIEAGIADAGGPAPLMTFHSTTSSSTGFNDADWLDFHMIQTGQQRVNHIVAPIAADRGRRPTRPVVIGEAAYEGVTQWANNFVKTPAMVRRTAYQSYFAGAAGYTYGHEPSTSVGVDAVWALGTDGGGWQALLEAPGARQMSLLSTFMTARAWWKWIPDPSILAGGETRPNGGSEPGQADEHLAVRSSDGDAVLVYFADRREAMVGLACITGARQATARWFNPADGTGQAVAGSFATSGAFPFMPPAGWEDAVLVIEASPKHDGARR